MCCLIQFLNKTHFLNQILVNLAFSLLYWPTQINLTSTCLMCIYAVKWVSAFVSLQHIVPLPEINHKGCFDYLNVHVICQ